MTSLTTELKYKTKIPLSFVNHYDMDDIGNAGNPVTKFHSENEEIDVFCQIFDSDIVIHVIDTKEFLLVSSNRPFTMTTSAINNSLKFSF